MGVGEWLSEEKRERERGYTKTTGSLYELALFTEVVAAVFN